MWQWRKAFTLRADGRVWTVGVSAGGKPNPACSEQYDRCWVLGPALVPGSALGFGGWNDWVINWRGSPKASLGHLEIWRNGELVLPKQMLATAYDDPEGPYLKFGVRNTSTSPMQCTCGRAAYSSDTTVLAAALCPSAGIPQPVERRGGPTTCLCESFCDRLRRIASG